MHSRKSSKILQQHENARPNKIAKRISEKVSRKINDDPLESDLNTIIDENTATNVDNVHEDGYQSNGDDIDEDAGIHENDIHFLEEYKAKHEESMFVNDDLPYFELNEADGCEPILDDYLSDEDVESSEGDLPDYYDFINDFDINQDIQKSLSELLQARSHADDYRNSAGIETPYDGSPFTTAQFQQEFMDVSNSNGLNQKVVKSLITLFNKHLPKLKLFHRPCLDDVNDICTLKYNYCESNCMVYAGRHQSAMDSCSFCGLARYRNNQNHVPSKTLYYKPITLTIYRLLEESPKRFLALINFSKNFPLNKYVDATDGSTFQKAMKQMKNQFNNKYPNNQSVIPVLIVISTFYDGAQIYKTKVSNFSPLMMTIMNLPPTYRKLGTGSFLVSFSTTPGKSAIENFLFHDCLVRELQNLGNGIEVTIKGQRYFITVQCKLSIMDTKQLESSLRVTGANSLNGCTLCGFHGVSYKKLNKVVYEPHRQFLELENACRSRGASSKCCPKDYYLTDDSFKRNDKVEISRVFGYANKRSIKDLSTNRRIDFKEMESLCCKDRLLREFLSEKSTMPYTFTQGKTDGCKENFNKSFATTLQYAHCCYLPQKIYERVSHENFSSHLKELIQQKGYDEKVVSYKGLKGAWYMLNLPATDIRTDVEFDPFHVIYNNGKYLIQLLKGLRGDTESIRQHAIQSDTFFPYLHDASMKAPWILDNTNQDYLDAVINNILIPVGYKSAFDVKHVFQRTGNLRGSDIINFLQCLLCYVSYCCAIQKTLPEQYASYLRLFSHDVNNLLRPFFSEDQIKEMEKSILQNVCIREGLFPVSEALFCVHQMIHLSSFIRNWGPLKGWWSLPGERMIASVKYFVPKGGTSIEKTVMVRYNVMEQVRRRLAYAESGESFSAIQQSYERVSDTLNPAVLEDLNDGTISLNPLKIILLKRNRIIERPCGEIFTPYEFNLLLLCLIRHIQKRFDHTEAEKKQMSSLYREYIYYTEERKATAGLSFLSYIKNENKHLHGQLMSENYYFFDQVNILGVVLHSRGFGYREKEEVRQIQYGEIYRNVINVTYGAQSKAQYVPKEECNQIENNWHLKKVYSAWLKYLDYGKNSSITKRYALANSFFRFRLESDSLLDGTGIASICSWYVDKSIQSEHNVNQLSFYETIRNVSTPKSRYDHISRFIPLTSIYSTAVGCSGMSLPTAADGPQSPFNVVITRALEEHKNHFATVPYDKIGYLYLIDLNPERLGVLAEDGGENDKNYRQFEL